MHGMRAPLTVHVQKLENNFGVSFQVPDIKLRRIFSHWAILLAQSMFLTKHKKEQRFHKDQTTFVLKTLKIHFTNCYTVAYIYHAQPIVLKYVCSTIS